MKKKKFNAPFKKVTVPLAVAVAMISSNMVSAAPESILVDLGNGQTIQIDPTKMKDLTYKKAAMDALADALNKQKGVMIKDTDNDAWLDGENLQNGGGTYNNVVERTGAPITSDMVEGVDYFAPVLEIPETIFELEVDSSGNAVAGDKVDAVFAESLEAAIKEAETILTISSQYDPDTIAALEVALEDAKSALNSSSQGDINDATTDLYAAIEAAVETRFEPVGSN